MRVLESVQALLARISRAMATERRLAQFTCGDCDRWERCGLAPDAKCTHRAEQIARDEWRDRRRTGVVGPV